MIRVPCDKSKCGNVNIKLDSVFRFNIYSEHLSAMNSPQEVCRSFGTVIPSQVSAQPVAFPMVSLMALALQRTQESACLK